uniref:Uncharacterized protein n=1 Tax=Setaria italica TaxID=4555 RepID=K3YXI0_SETIT
MDALGKLLLDMCCSFRLLERGSSSVLGIRCWSYALLYSIASDVVQTYYACDIVTKTRREDND